MTNPHPISPSTLLADLNWRYAVKAFDPEKTISHEIWKVLEEALVLTPSSFGLQPWKFFVITDKEMKAKLRTASWGQAQVTDCSHYVVFASKKKINTQDIDAFLALTAEVRGVEIASLQGYRKVIVNHLVEAGVSQTVNHWAANQTFIALGNFMTSASLLKVDTCPMEGFVPQEYDKILGLEAQGLTASVCCAAGYRSESDKHASLAKIRFAPEKVIEHIG